MKALVRLMLTTVVLVVLAANLPAQTFTVLDNFSLANGTCAETGPVSGNTMYGMNYYGGAGGAGTIFNINLDGTGFTVLYTFTNGVDGANPDGLLLVGCTLYGTANTGGVGNNGTVFALSTNGSGFTVLHAFSAFQDGRVNHDGAYPNNPAIEGHTLYGTTTFGGNGGNGVVFAMPLDGVGFTNLYNFTATNANGSNADGAQSDGGPIVSGNTLYGTTFCGGASAVGTVFAIQTDGSVFRTLHQFTGASDGAHPMASLVSSAIMLYGTACDGGAANTGTVFALDTNGANFMTLHDFSPLYGVGFNADGAYPQAALLLSGDTLFGTAIRGGEGDYFYFLAGGGSIFAVSANGSDFTTLHSFHYATDGSDVWSPLLLVRNTLYGTTAYNGGFAYGTAFGLRLDLAVSFNTNPVAGDPLGVQFNSPPADSYGMPISSWSWNFGDGSTSSVPNPSHHYSAIGVYNAQLVATNENGATVSASGPSVVLGSSIANGAFDTGDFSGWTISGNTDYVVVTRGSYQGIVPLTGACDALLGTEGSLEFLSQSVTTVPQQVYLLSLWLDSPDGLTPNRFLVRWNGTSVFDQTNISVVGWTNLQFLVMATATNAVLQFGFQNDPSYFGLDDVFLGVPQLAALQSNTNVVLSWPAIGQSLALESSTNLAISNAWTPVSLSQLMTGGQVVVTNGMCAGQMFYRLRR